MDLRQENRHLRNVKWNNEREIYRLTNKLRETEYLLEKERRTHMGYRHSDQITRGGS